MLASAGIVRKNLGRGFVADEQDRYVFLGLFATLGRHDTFNELVSGLSYMPRLRWQANRPDDGGERFFSFTQGFLWAQILPRRQNIALRLIQGHASRSSLSQGYYLGGLDQIRGFAGSEFSGSNFVFQNLEYRAPWFWSDQRVLQQAVFYDSSLINLKEGDRYVHSLGSGLRCFAPHFYRTTFRLDYAASLGPFPEGNFSFGLQQFF